MSIHLMNETDEMHVAYSDWSQLLQLAEDYGWQPDGTIQMDLKTDEVRPERGGYFTSDYQRVTDTDAANMATALERALPDITGADNKEWVREVIAFCRAGGFTIS
jgi:hypothetical protein